MLQNSTTIFISLAFICCGQTSEKASVSKINSEIESTEIINRDGKTVETRFKTPFGFDRRFADKETFNYYLRNLPLKQAGSKVKYYNNNIKTNDVYEAVVDMEITNKDLQQCADAVIRLRGEYFYSLKQYEKISFKLTNGFEVNYTEWMSGKRIKVVGNKTSWYQAKEASNSYKDFRAYMDFIFSYAGTISLNKSLHKKNIKDIAPGDVFIVGGSPGHAVIVVDVAENKSGEKVFMLAQSYMPAQETQILKNISDKKISPWYRADFSGSLFTPEWVFNADQLKTW